MISISVNCKASQTETLSYETCMFISSRHCADVKRHWTPGITKVHYGLYMHSRTPVGFLRSGIIKDHSDAGEITRMSKKRVQTGNFSDYVPLLIEANSST